MLAVFGPCDTTGDDDNDNIDKHSSSYPYQSNNHVFFGFPYEDNYNGTGVFSHLIKLKHEQWTNLLNGYAGGLSGRMWLSFALLEGMNS